MSKELVFGILTMISVFGVFFGVITDDSSFTVIGGFAVFFFGSCIGVAHNHI